MIYAMVRLLTSKIDLLFDTRAKQFPEKRKSNNNYRVVLIGAAGVGLSLRSRTAAHNRHSNPPKWYESFTAVPSGTRRLVHMYQSVNYGTLLSKLRLRLLRRTVRTTYRAVKYSTEQYPYR